MLSLEVAHADFGAGHTTVNGTENAVLAGGYVSQTAVLANAAYEIPYRDNINWIAGAGAGLAQVSPISSMQREIGCPATIPTLHGN